MAVSEMSLQFLCSRCNSVLKEETAGVEYEAYSGPEFCPTCGDRLAETLQVKKKSTPKLQTTQFKTAYDLSAKLSLGLEQIDNLANITAQDRVCIAGYHAGLIVTRLCVRALMPIRSGGFGSQSVVFIDAGNSSDVYQCVNFARQYGMNIEKVLQSMVVSRAFTIYQLAGLIVYELAGIIEKTHAKIIIVSDLLSMFVEDPQINEEEASYIINEIAKSLLNISDDILIIASLHKASPYDDLIFSHFDKQIALARADKEQVNVTLRHNHKSDCVSIPERDLRIAQIR